MRPASHGLRVRGHAVLPRPVHKPGPLRPGTSVQSVLRDGRGQAMVECAAAGAAPPARRVAAAVRRRAVAAAATACRRVIMVTGASGSSGGWGEVESNGEAEPSSVRMRQRAARA